MTYMYGSRPRNNNGVVAQEIDNNSLQIQIQQQSTMIQELKNEIQDKKVILILFLLMLLIWIMS